MCSTGSLPVHPDVPDGLRALNAAGVRIATPRTARRRSRAGCSSALVSRRSSAVSTSRRCAAGARARALPVRMLRAGRGAGRGDPDRRPPWDVHGAKRAGLRGAWLDCSGVPRIFERPDVSARDLPASCPRSWQRDLALSRAQSGTIATTRAGAALAPTTGSGKQATWKPLGGQLAEVRQSLDLRVRQVGLVRRPEEPGLVALERLCACRWSGPSQPHASIPITRTGGRTSRPRRPASRAGRAPGSRGRRAPRRGPCVRGRCRDRRARGRRARAPPRRRPRRCKLPSALAVMSSTTPGRRNQSSGSSSIVCARSPAMREL